MTSANVASAGNPHSTSMMRSRVRRSITIEFYASLPWLAVSNDSSPIGWSQKWAHRLLTTANCLEISTSDPIPSIALGAGRRWFGIRSPRPLFRRNPHDSYVRRGFSRWL